MFNAPSIRLEMGGVAESTDGNSIAGSQVFFVIAELSNEIRSPARWNFGNQRFFMSKQLNVVVSVFRVGSVARLGCGHFQA